MADQKYENKFALIIGNEDYSELSKNENWRKVLSNFHVYPFIFEGSTYNTIEHAFQSQKIKIVNPEIASYFTLESKHFIGKGDGSIAQKHRKIVILSKSDLEKWESINVMEQIAIEKYKQCNSAMSILKLTKNAELWHQVFRQSPVRFHHLEKIRKK